MLNNKKQLFTIVILVIGTLIAGLLSHGMYMFYNFLILPLLGLVAYVGLKKKWPLAILGIFLVSGTWQFITMARDGMFEQKMYLETLTGALSMAFIYLSLSLLGTALGSLFTYAFSKSSEAKGKKIMKVLSGLGGLVIILGLGSLTNAFIGNPISAYLAHNGAEKYIEENYEALDLELGKASYNFKFDIYMVRATSKTSPDTYFSIDVDSFGHVESDNYKGSVLSGSNTYRRLNEGFEDFVEPYIEKNMPYEFDMIIAQLDDRESSIIKQLKRDVTYDVTEIPMKSLITVYLYSDDLSWENVAKVTLELDALMEKANLEVAEYTVVLEPLVEETEKKGESFGIYDFPKEKLKSPDLAKEMEAFFNTWNQGKK